MTLVHNEQIVDTKFYAANEAHQSEARRLELMAEYADYVSLIALNGEIDTPYAVCIDVGAGDSTSLGEKIRERNPSAFYLPVDLRSEAVAKHNAAGFPAEQGYATDLPHANDTADLVHTRFTMAWLDDASRKRAFEEMMRVGNENVKLAIIDYDWSVTSGPEPFNRLVDQVTGIMRGFGFNPNYGATVAEETVATMKAYGYDATSSKIDTHRTNITNALARAMDTVDQTVLPVYEKLLQAGLAEDAATLHALYEDLKSYAAQNPDEEVRFPDIVEVTAKLTGREHHTEALALITLARAAGKNALDEEYMAGVGPTELSAYRLTGKMKDQARRLHASAYRNYGYVTEEGINENGFLVEEIVPQELTERSIALGAINEEGTVTGGIQVIPAAESESLRSLPTIIKIEDALGKDSPILKELPFMDGSKKVAEISGLGKSAQSKDPQVLSKLLLAALCETIDQGNDYAVMTIVEGTARLLTMGYGKEAFQRIDGDAAIVTLHGKGINPKGVRLVPFYVKLNEFTQNCIKHMEKNPDSDFAKANLPLFRTVDQFVK
jgi:hypothetical protein